MADLVGTWGGGDVWRVTAGVFPSNAYFCRAGVPGGGILVDPGLEIREERRTALYLIENGAVVKAAEEAPRVGLGEGALVEILERDVRFGPEDLPGECGLPRLAGAGDRHQGIAGRKPLENRRCLTRDQHSCQRSGSPADCQFN